MVSVMPQPCPPLCQMPLHQEPLQFRFHQKTLYLIPSTPPSPRIMLESSWSPSLVVKGGELSEKWLALCPMGDRSSAGLQGQAIPAHDLSLQQEDMADGWQVSLPAHPSVSLPVPLCFPVHLRWRITIGWRRLVWIAHVAQKRALNSLRIIFFYASFSGEKIEEKLCK